MMSNPVSDIKQSITALVRAALDAAAASGTLSACAELPAFVVEIPADTSHGDFATNAAMVCARTFRCAPRKVAEAICQNLVLEGSGIERVEIAGPGFINFFLGRGWFSEAVHSVLAQGDAYGRTSFGNGEKVQVEFVSANPTGPMHMGNARGGAIGDCLAAALDWAGYEVTREFYVNDAGNQIEKFGRSLEARYLQIYQGEDAVEFPEDGYHGDDIKARAQEFADLHGNRLVQADGPDRRRELIGYALPKNIEKLRQDLESYRIAYDVWFLESTLHNGAIDQAIQRLSDRGMTYEKEGALWYKATENGGEKDEVLVRANGFPTYFAADIAYHYNKFAVRGFDRVINVWGADHHGHVARLKGAMDAIGLDGSKLDIVLMQLVRLMKDGKPYKMSKRTGKAVSLTDLIEEVPVDAARFYFNMREPNSTFDFDLDLAIEQSAQNPVYYVQYAHARICSILRKLAEEGVSPRACTADELDAMDGPFETELIRCLARFPQEIVETARSYDPAKLTKYAIEAATLFHKFYDKCRIRGEAEPLMQARLNLCLAVRTVLRNVLTILKITVPESM
ncbi:arginine-tRNA ligase [Anaerotruncus sp. G3(2012)]|nr:arginine-tRNA ligase [Anaerotruncus sp. G3(2012)]